MSKWLFMFAVRTGKRRDGKNTILTTLKKISTENTSQHFESLRMRNHGITHYFAVADLISIILYWNE